MPFLQPRVRFAFLLLALFCLSACKPKIKKIKSPDHYSFARVYTDKLDLVLKELSGLTWDSKNNLFLAVNDESGKLFFLNKSMHLLPERPTFGDAGDYEDVAIYDGTPYVLRSDGMLTKLIRDTSGTYYGVQAGKIPLSGSNDFETLYTDAERKALILICKNCAADNGSTVSAFAYYPDSIGFDARPVFTIDADAIAKLSPFKSSKFQPSAAAIHPILHKLYIVSSASRQLAVTSLDGKPEAVYELGKTLFPQPEGIAFRKDGTMWIANEGVTSKATVCQFTYDSAVTASAGGTHYGDFSKPDEKMELGDHLHEISGMAWIPGKNEILAENDEKGQIFTLDFINKKDMLGKVKFGGKGDYEDIVYTDDAIYMLVSSGGIVRVDTKDSAMTTTDINLFEKNNEFETLYLDKARNSLIMLCKECDHEKKTGVRSAYRFDLATQTFDPNPVYTIDISEIQKMINDDQAEFKPSAAGISPADGKLYIVASVGKLLVVANKDTGKPEKVFRLDPALYNQPEGMTFAPNGDLYISNEGGEGIATILKFAYRK